MAITILPQQGSFGQSVGESIGQGLGSGLTALANMKMQEYGQRQLMKMQQEMQKEQQERQAQQLEQTLGPGWGALAVLGEKYGPLALQGGWRPGTQMQQGQPQQQGPIDLNQYLGLQPKQMSFKDLMQQYGGQQQAQQQSSIQMPGAQPTSDLATAIQQGVMNTPQMRFQAAENEKNRELKQNIAEKKLGYTEKEARIKEATPFIDAVTNQHRSWLEEKADLNRMLHISKTGKITDPKLHALMKRFGLDIGGLQNADTQELAKLAAKRLRGVKEISPKATNLDVQAYEKTIPGLMLTPEGRERVIKEYLEMGEYIDKVYKVTQQRLKTKDYEQPFFKQRIYEDIDKLYPEFLEKYTTGGKNFAKGDVIENEDDLKFLSPGTPVTKDGIPGIWDGSNWKPA